MKYVSIDIETLGIEAESCSLIEVGAVIDDMQSPLSELPVFHRYITYPNNHYQGDVWAMFMHAKSGIFERIANRDPDYSYCNYLNLDIQFFGWLRKHLGLKNKDKVLFVGKNAAWFDLPFLQKSAKFGMNFSIHHRVLDVGSMFVDMVNDQEPPNLEECLRRAGIQKNISHTAVEDAIDVIRCIRFKHGVSDV